MAEGYWGKYWRRRVSRRRVLAGSATLAAGSAAILAGCGDDDDDDGGEDPTATQAGGETPSGGETPQATEPSGGPTVGGTFHNHKASQNTTLDPSVTVTDQAWTAKTYNHLVGYSLVEDTAWGDAGESWEQVDDTTLVFTLRPDLKFNPEAANGRAMTSEDVAFSYSRFPTSLAELGSEVNQIQWGWMGVDRGASFDTPDATTLQINQAFAWASNIPSLGSSAMAIVAKELVEANSDLRDVPNAGGGAYMFSRRDESGNTYVRNPNYYKHGPGAGRFAEDLPYIDSWEDEIIVDAAAREARFLAGDSDSLGIVDKLKAEELEGEENVAIMTGPSNDHSVMELDAFKWAQHPKLREALSLSIDWDSYIDIILNGEGIRGAPVGPSFPQVLSQDEIAELQQYNPQRAQQLWEEGAGNEVFPDGLKTVTATFGSSTRHIEFVAQSIEQSIGVSTEFIPADLATYVALATAPPGEKVWHYFIAGENSLSTIPDYNALTHYAPVGYGAIFGGLYYSGHALASLYDASVIAVTDPIGSEIQGFYDLQGATVDAEERKQVLRDLQEYIFTNFCCAFPLPVQSTNYFAIGARVRNAPPVPDTQNNASMGYHRAQTMWLEA